MFLEVARQQHIDTLLLLAQLVSMRAQSLHLLVLLVLLCTSLRTPSRGLESQHLQTPLRLVDRLLQLSQEPLQMRSGHRLLLLVLRLSVFARAAAAVVVVAGGGGEMVAIVAEVPGTLVVACAVCALQHAVEAPLVGPLGLLNLALDSPEPLLIPRLLRCELTGALQIVERALDVGLRRARGVAACSGASKESAGVDWIQTAQDVVAGLDAPLPLTTL